MKKSNNPKWGSIMRSANSLQFKGKGGKKSQTPLGMKIKNDSCATWKKGLNSNTGRLGKKTGKRLRVENRCGGETKGPKGG